LIAFVEELGFAEYQLLSV